MVIQKKDVEMCRACNQKEKHDDVVIRDKDEDVVIIPCQCTRPDPYVHEKCLESSSYLHNNRCEFCGAEYVMEKKTRAIRKVRNTCSCSLILQYTD